MDSIDLRIADLAALHDMAEKADDETIELTDDADELLMYIVNDEPAYIEFEKIRSIIATEYELFEGEIPDFKRDRFIRSIGRIARQFRDQAVDSGFMTFSEADRAIPLLCKYVYHEAVIDARKAQEASE